MTLIEHNRYARLRWSPSTGFRVDTAHASHPLGHVDSEQAIAEFDRIWRDARDQSQGVFGA